MKRRWPAMLVFTAFFLTLTLLGCTRDQTDATKRSLQESEQAYSTTDLNSLKEHSPFSLNLPTYLPAGYNFTGGLVEPALQGHQANTRVNMSFGAENKPSLLVTESRGEIVLSGQTTDIQLGGHEGKMQKISRSDGSVLVSIAFKARDVYHVITAQGIPEAELIRVAESMSQ